MFISNHGLSTKEAPTDTNDKTCFLNRRRWHSSRINRHINRTWCCSIFDNQHNHIYWQLTKFPSRICAVCWSVDLHTKSRYGYSLHFTNGSQDQRGYLLSQGHSAKIKKSRQFDSTFLAIVLENYRSMEEKCVSQLGRGQGRLILLFHHSLCPLKVPREHKDSL